MRRKGWPAPLRRLYALSRNSAWNLEGLRRHVSPSRPESFARHRRQARSAFRPSARRQARAAPMTGVDRDDRSHQGPETEMLDIIFIASGVAFFAVGILYVIVCDRL
jgi:hypothetical protein